MAGISAGLSILGGLSGNSAIERAATNQYNANKLFIERDSKVAQEGLQYAATDVNNEVGMMLSNLVQQGRQAHSEMATKRAETNIYGNTAARQEAVLSTKEALSADNLIQQAESKMVDVQTQMRQANYQTQAQHASNKQNYNNMMSQQQSSFEMVTGAVSSGLSGYSMGLGLESAQTALDAKKAELLALQQ